MPTLPLFDPAASPGDWHGVITPGGYESWALDAQDPSTDTQVMVVFTTGAQQYLPYLKQHAVFRRSPTTVSPPSPVHHAGVLVCVYRAGHLLRRTFLRGKVAVTDPKLDLTIGYGRLWRTGEAWSLTCEGLELTFTPTLPAGAARPVLKFLNRLHVWTPLVPRCDVAGSVDGGAFNGVGTVEHAFGEAPVCYGLTRLIRGRVFTDSTAMQFHLAVPKDPRRRQGVTLLEATSAGTTELHEASITGPYADTIDFRDRLRLTRPRIVDSHARGVRVIYHAESPTGRGAAHCDVFYPQPPRRTFKKVLTDWLSGTE